MRPPVSTCDLITVGAADVLRDRAAPPPRRWRNRAATSGCPPWRRSSGIRIRRTSWGAAAYPGRRMRLAPHLFSGAAAPARPAPPPPSVRSRSLTDDGVQYGTPHELRGHAHRRATAPAGGPARRAAGPRLPVRRRVRDDRHGDHRRRRHVRLRARGSTATWTLRAVAPGPGRAQRRRAAPTSTRARARPSRRSRATGCGSRSSCAPRRTCRLTARTTFYLGPKNAKTAEPVARAKPQQDRPRPLQGDRDRRRSRAPGRAPSATAAASGTPRAAAWAPRAPAARSATASERSAAAMPAITSAGSSIACSAVKRRVRVARGEQVLLLAVVAVVRPG